MLSWCFWHEPSEALVINWLAQDMCSRRYNYRLLCTLQSACTCFELCCTEHGEAQYLACHAVACFKCKTCAFIAVTSARMLIALPQLPLPTLAACCSSM